MKTRSYLCALLVLATGCAIQPTEPLPLSKDTIVLLDPVDTDAWEHRVLRKGSTTYDQARTGLGNSIRAEGNVSASIFFRIFEPVSPGCQKLNWEWFVSEPQRTSDLRTKGMDDVAASVFVLFGDPGIFRDTPVPTLRYAWANSRHDENQVIVGPYQKEYVRTIIVRTGKTSERRLVAEQRDLIADFERVFGRRPEDGIHGVAIFTDNDDTSEPIVAHYGRIWLECVSAAGGPGPVRAHAG